VASIEEREDMMSWFFVQVTTAEFDVILRLVNSGGVIAALAYAFSIERRLARIEGSIKGICPYAKEREG